MNISTDKVRIGIALGGWPFPSPDPQLLWDYIEKMETLDIDSIWFTDRIVSPVFSLETVVAMSFIASRTENLKFGTSVIALPLRNPTVLAKELATIDFLSNGRCLPAVGLGTEDEIEYEACGTSKKVRVSRTEEAVEIMRLLWTENNVHYQGKHFKLNGVSVEPKPVQKQLPPIWFGGRSEPALRRTAKLGDGWLVSQAPPEEVAMSVPKIKEMASDFNNSINSLLFLKLKNFERDVPTNLSLFSFIILAAESFKFKIFPVTQSSKNNGSSENSIKALYFVSKLLYFEYSLSNANCEFTNFF